MSRRPKLLPGNLYLVKDRGAYNPATDKECTCLYVGLLREIGQTATLMKNFNLKPDTGFYLDVQVLASDFIGTSPGYTHRLFFDRTFIYEGDPLRAPNTITIQKFDPKNLPLYMNWEWNEWILERLKQQ